MRIEDEKDPEILRKAVAILERENKRLVDKIMELTRELVTLKGGGAEQLKLRIAELERQLAVRNRMLFGTKSEKRSGDDGAQPAPEPPKPPQKGHGPKPQPALEVVEVVHELDEADKVCTSCGGALDVWEGQFEESEEIDLIERRFFIKKHKRQKYRCRCGGCIETALPPVKLFDGARYSVDFAIEVAYEKYSEHSPLERQARKMGREGLDVESQTLWDQIERLAALMTPGYEALGRYVLSKPVIGGDETTWPVFGKDKSAKSWHAWAVAVEHAVVYWIDDSRSTKAARKMLDGYKGALMCDGYAAYESLAKDNVGLVLAHCWAHARRKFVDIESHFPEACKTMLELIGELYAVERLCPKGREGDDERRRLRQERSKGIVERIRGFLMSTYALPESGLGKAIQYVTGRWSGLTRFLDDPRIALDNNATERALRGVVVGRKNHYGSRSLRGTEVAALFYSMIESAKLNGLNPKAYLRMATMAALRGEQIPLPHEVAALGVA
jgi:transposase